MKKIMNHSSRPVFASGSRRGESRIRPENNGDINTGRSQGSPLQVGLFFLFATSSSAFSGAEKGPNTPSPLWRGLGVRFSVVFFLLFALLSCEHPAKVDIGELVEALNALDADSSAEDEDDLAADDLTDLSAEAEAKADADLSAEAEADLSDEGVVPESEADEDGIVTDEDVDSIAMSCTADVCVDSTTGLMWQRGNSEKMNQYDAADYCSTLVLGEHEDWRLPTISELRTLIRGCEGTVTGGACDASDECLSVPSCYSTDCYCSQGGGLGENGFYWEKGIWDYVGDITGETGVFWSSSIDADNVNKAWYVYFSNGGVTVNTRGDPSSNYARCVRNVPSLNDDDDDDVLLTENDVFPDDDCCALPTELPLCTGQTQCCNDTILIACPTEGNAFYGQDAQYAALGLCTTQSYSIIGTIPEEIVVDNITELMWQRTLPADYDDCGGTWCTWQQAMNYCDTLSYGGYSIGWRLPTVAELETLYGYGGSAIDTTAFPDTPAKMFWTMTPSLATADDAWYVNGTNGFVDTFSKSDNGFVARCIRDGSLPGKNFIESTEGGKEIVTEITTGLVWTKEHSSTTLTWEAALNYCETLSYADYTDWRLPNIIELKTLVNRGVSNPASDFPGMSSIDLWSSSSLMGNVARAWYVKFIYGATGDNLKSTPSYVICVR